MATTDAKTIIDKAAIQLGDIDKVHWTESELLGWLNDAQLKIVTLAPQTNVKNSKVRLIPGVKQAIPADGILILDIPFNYRSNGTLVGEVINKATLEIMNKRVPGWITATQGVTVRCFIYSPSDPSVFYVYPPQPALSTQVEMVYSARPELITNAYGGTKITVDDQYQDALLDFVLFKAFDKDSEYGNQDVKKNQHYQLFLQAIGITPQPEKQKPKAQ